MPLIGGGAAPPITPQALWLWNSGSGIPTVSGYPNAYGTYGPTKTGVTPQQLQNFVGVPLQYYGNPPVPMADADLIQWIRFAEDKIEQETSILLCQTWVASPPAVTPEQCVAIGVIPVSGYMQQGIDYDLPDAAYDFIFSRWQDSGWGEITLRYRPVQDVTYGPFNMGAIKRTSMIYPLLNQFFTIPPTWNVEDHDFGVVRYVPAVNVQMLPLFAMQMAFMGFTENVPGAIWLQYKAGLTPFDLQNRWSFMQQLVLCEAAVIALNAAQGTINLGALSYKTDVDGLTYEVRYDAKGPYNGLIESFTRLGKPLWNTARSKVAGPMFTMLGT